MFLYLITGKTGTQISFFSRLLKNHGLKQVVWKKEVLAKKERIENRPTFLIGYEKNKYFYYLNKKSLLDKDFCIIYPDLITPLLDKMPDVIFQVVYLQANQDKRQKDYLRLHPKQENKFIRLNNDEKSKFDLLDQIAKADKPDLSNLPSNLDAIHSIIDRNDKALNDLQIWAKTLTDNQKMQIRLTNMIIKSSNLGLTKAMPDGRIEAAITDKNENSIVTRYIPPAAFAATILHDTKTLTQFLLQLIAKDDDLDKIYPDS